MKIKKQNSIKNKLLLFIGMFFVVTIVFGALKTKAGTLQNVTGWLWGGSEQISDGNANNGNSGYETGVGWISTNSSNCDTNNNGIIDAAEFSANTACPPVGTNVAQNWGLNIPLNGTISGYAWSPNIGSISFNATDNVNCPIPDPTYGCSAQSHGNGNSLTGWARIIGICDSNADNKCDAGESNPNSGGWIGWMKLSGKSQDNTSYGVNIDSNGKLSGYAWSDELGAIKFDPPSNGATAGVPTVALNTSPSQLIILTQGKKLSDLSAAERTINLSWTTSGAIASCVATCASGICDPTWTGNLVIAPPASMNKNIIVPTNGQDGVYQINCYDGSNGTGNLVAQTSKDISVGCYGNTCQSESCVINNASFIPAVDYATCASVPNSTCSSSQDCKARVGSDWHETAL